MAEFLINRGRTVIYSTVLPPPSAAAALAALDVLQAEPERVQRLQSNARLPRSELAACGFAVPEGEIPIVPLIIGEAEETVALCEAGLRRGVFAQAIRPPTVPDGTSRLRLAAMATHRKEDLRGAAATLASLRSSHLTPRRSATSHT